MLKIINAIILEMPIAKNVLFSHKANGDDVFSHFLECAVSDGAL